MEIVRVNFVWLVVEVLKNQGWRGRETRQTIGPATTRAQATMPQLSPFVGVRISGDPTFVVVVQATDPRDGDDLPTRLDGPRFRCILRQA